MNPFSVRNKVVLITGTSRGIGKNTAETFLKLGAIVIGISTKKNIKIKHKNYTHFSCNLESTKQIKSTINKVFRIKNKIDVLINNAGMTKESPKNINDCFKIFDKTIKINLAAPYQISLLAVNFFKKNKNGGTIINISSIGGELGFPNNPAYVASKGGLKMLTKSLAKDFGKFGIRVNNLGPGYIVTDMTKNSYKDKKFRLIRQRHTLLNRWGNISDLVGPCIFLSSDSSGYVTGQDLYVDGGLKGHFPIEACKSKHYLGLNVRGGTTSRENFGILKDLPILKFTIDLMNDRDNNIDPDDDKIFTYHINGGLNFSLDINQRKKMIEKGYNETIEYLRVMNNI